MNNQYGKFSDDGMEYIITTPNTPRHWQNYLWNGKFLSIFSHLAQGKALCQDSQGYRTNLITSRMVYILDTDSNEMWTANGLPIRDDYKYNCVHGMGYSKISITYNEIESIFTAFVPSEDECEIWSVEFKNTGGRERNLKIIPFFGTAIHGAHEGSFPAAHAYFDNDVQGVIGSNVVRFGSHFSHETTGRTEDGFFVTDVTVTGFDCSLRAFIGEYNTEMFPYAVIKGGCTNSACEFEQIVFALETTITLKPNETKKINTIAGVTKEKEVISLMKNKYFNNNFIDLELKKIKEGFIKEINNIQISTTNSEFDLFFNTWLKHQLNFNSVWARVYFNGFRDLCQDAENYSIINLEGAKKRFIKVLSYQYANGYAPRAWGEGTVIEQDYSDSPVWITSTVYGIIKEEGNFDFLDTEVTFIEGENATVYEHMKRSIDYLWNDRGIHGLSKIHSGDWNDVMNAVGSKGRGESVWLSMALYRALSFFAEIAQATGNTIDAELASQRAEELKENVNEHGWDGNYYIRAYTDDGVAVGSESSDGGNLFLNPQSWAVISSIGSTEKMNKAMDMVDKYLELDIGISTLHGVFEKFRNDIGFISAIRPGENLNGGVYLHANLFKIVADCMAKRNESAFKTVEKILPFSKYRNIIHGEPYVMPNSYFGEKSKYRYGEAGASWITGTSGWLVYAVVNYIFGLKPEISGLKIEPCLPSEWKKCTIERPFRKAKYIITFIQEDDGVCNTIKRTIVNDEEIKGNILPYCEGGNYKVTVILGN